MPTLEAITVKFPERGSHNTLARVQHGTFVTGLIKLPDRVVRFRPIGIDTRGDGKKAIVTWQQEHEALIEFRGVHIVQKT